MSYIRSTNNPEKLYIWGSEKMATITMGTEIIGQLPNTVMNGLIKRYLENYNEDTKYADAIIKEVKDANGDFKMELSYKNEWKCLMWGVTWDYIAYTNYHRIIKREKFFKTRK